MGRDISIAISARDNYSSAITTMRNANQQFNKDLEGLTTKLDKLNDTKISLKVDTDKARTALRDAEKQFAKTGDAADELALKLANEGYENARRNLDLVSKNARQAEKDILNLTDAVSRSENRVGGMAGSTGGTDQNMMSSLAKAGLGKMLGDSVSNTANVMIGSAFGDAMGSAISTTLSGTLTGAAMGSMIAPGIGTAIGAAVGTAAGAINAYAQNFQKEDDAFKSVRNEMVENVLQRQQSDLTAGVDIASTRQKKMVQYKHMFGNEDLAKAYVQDTIALANKTPFYYDDLTGIGSVYKAFGYSNDELYEEQLRIANAAAIRSWETSDMEQVAQVLGYMRQSGKVNLQQVKQLQMRGLNIPKYLSIAGSKVDDQEFSKDEILSLINASDDELKERGIKLTEDDIYTMISKGEIDGKKAARAISDYMAVEFEGGAEKLAETYYGMFSTIGGLEQQMQNAMGEGFMAKREEGLAKQIEWFSGASGEEMQKANRLIGEWEASLVNTKERMEREILSAVMTGESLVAGGIGPSKDYTAEQMRRIDELSAEYQLAIAENNGAEAGKILAQAQIEAQAAYNASEGAQIEAETQRKLVSDVTSTLVADKTYWNAGYLLGEEMSKGMKSAVLNNAHDLGISLAGVGGYSSNPRSSVYGSSGGFTSSNPRSHYSGKAFGMPYIPYDDYVIRAHQGERLLTASEARAQDKDGTTPISINTPSVIIREEADLYKFAQAFVSEIKKAQLIS